MHKLPFLLVAFAVVAPVSGQAAVLRTLTTLSAPVVLLSDLFDDAGPKSARVLGPAPAPGERIVVEAAQLAAIARQFNVEWRPASSGDRAVLDRPGRLLPREALTAALDGALTRVGAPSPNEIDLPGFEAPMVPAETQPQVRVEQVEYDAATGHFSAAVLVSGETMLALRLRLSGHVEEVVGVAVPARRLLAGTALRAGDFVPAQVRAGMLRGEVLRTPEQATGLALRHAAAAGQPVALADLQRPTSVAKGAHVTMELRMPGITVMAQGVAQQSGATGERVQVLNPSSRMLVDAEVTGPNRVGVDPDSVPAPAPGPGAAQVALQ